MLRHRIEKRTDLPYEPPALHWPLDVLFIVLGGFVLGVSLAHRTFDDPVWYRNAWTSVVVIPVFVVAALIAARLLSRRWMRRSMQVGMLASLLVHLLLVLFALNVVLPYRLWQKPSTQDQVATERLPVLAERVVVERALGRSVQDQVLPPLETPTPQPVEPPVERASTDRSPFELQPQVVEHPQPTTRPDIVRYDPSTAAEVRQRPTAGQFSASRVRREPTTEVTPATAAQAEATTSAASSADSPVAASVSVARAPTSAVQVPKPAETSSPAHQSAPPVALTRPAYAQTDSTDAQSPTTVRRHPVRTPSEPSLAAESVPRATTWSRDPPVITPAPVEVSRPADNVASSGRQTDDVDASLEPSRNVEIRRNDAQAAPLVAQAVQPLPDRRRVMVERPQSDMPDSAETTASPTSASASVAPAATSIVRRQTAETSAELPALAEPTKASAEPQVLSVAARRAAAELQPMETPISPGPRKLHPSSAAPEPATPEPATASTVAETSQPSASPVASSEQLRPTDTPFARQAESSPEVFSRQPADEPRQSPQEQLASAVFRRSLTADEATLLARERPAPVPARAASGLPRTTMVLESPSTTASVADADTAQATPIALSKGTVGTAGAGYSENLDRAAPAAESPALVASGASLPRAAQMVDPGPALSPSRAALVPRGHKDGPAPQTQMAAQTSAAEQAIAVGQTGASQTAAPAPVDLAARAERSQTTGEQGRIDVDLGPERVVAQLQAHRGSGGGRPELSATTSPRPVRAPTRGGLPPALRTDTMAETTTAPPGSGGSRPPAIDAVAAAVSAARTDPSGESPVSGHTASAPQEGPASEPNAADSLGAISLRRATSNQDSSQGMMVATAQPRGRLAPRSVSPAAAVPPNTAEPAGNSALPDTSALASTSSDLRYTSVSSQSAQRPGEPASPELASVDLAATRENLTGGAVVSPQPATDNDPPVIVPDAFDPKVRVRSMSAYAPAGPTLPGSGAHSQQRPAVSRDMALDRLGVPTAEQVVWNATAPEGSPPQPSSTGTSLRREVGNLSVAPNPEATPAERIAAESSPAAITVRAAGSAQDGAPAAVVPPVVVAKKEQRTGTVPATALTGPPAQDSAVAQAAFAPEENERMDAGEVLVGRPAMEVARAAFVVEADASPGDGGLAVQPAPDVGILDRRARRDTLQVQVQPARIARRQPSGLPATNTAPVLAAEAFRPRLERTRPGGGDRLGPETEQAIELGLSFLSRHQQADGRWSLQGFDEPPPAMNSDVAATGLAVLAFQGAGYTHREHQYREVVRRGIDFLLASQQPEGLLYVEGDQESNRVTRLYSHAIATLALCEAYGMTQDPALREPAQRALDYIAAAQSPQLGGWRYAPQVSSDTSVSGWMLMALKSGDLAGLSVSEKTYQLVVRWLDRAQGDQPHLYRYNPDAPDTPTQRHGRVPSATMTAVGLLMRLYTGWNRNHPAMQAGGQYLLENLPGMSDLGDPVASRRRDTYYWYYATQVMFHLGGEHWRVWNGRLHPMLVNSQVTSGPYAGSWEPFRPVPDRWAAHAGRLYVTTMNLLSLEVAYRHLPLYDSTAR